MCLAIYFTTLIIHSSHHVDMAHGRPHARLAFGSHIIHTLLTYIPIIIILG
jgi:hypothetical protein